MLFRRLVGPRLDIFFQEIVDDSQLPHTGIHVFYQFLIGLRGLPSAECEKPHTPFKKVTFPSLGHLRIHAELTG